VGGGWLGGWFCWRLVGGGWGGGVLVGGVLVGGVVGGGGGLVHKYPELFLSFEGTPLLPGSTFRSPAHVFWS